MSDDTKVYAYITGPSEDLRIHLKDLRDCTAYEAYLTNTTLDFLQACGYEPHQILIRITQLADMSNSKVEIFLGLEDGSKLFISGMQWSRLPDASIRLRAVWKPTPMGAL